MLSIEVLKVKCIVFAACVPSCTTCAYTTEATKSYTTCSGCTDLYALTSSNLCSS